MTATEAHEELGRMITGYWISQAIHAAAKLKLADELAGGPRTAEELAGAVGAHGPSLYRLLRMLASVGIFSEGDDGRFRLTPLAEAIRSDVPGSRWAMAVMMGDPEHYRPWGDLVETIRTGETAFDRLFGKPIFAHLAENPESARIFDAAMTSIHGRETRATLDAYDFGGIATLADVGGGNGSNLAGILGRHPQMRGVLFDLPHVVERAGANLQAAGVAGRCEVVEGDFFESVPVRADAYFLRHIIHDWDDERALTILRHIRRAMPEGARLLVVEHVLPRGDAPSFGKLLDINMLLIPGGKERTEAEFARLYEQAGFRLNRVVPTEGDLSVVEGAAA